MPVKSLLYYEETMISSLKTDEIVHRMKSMVRKPVKSDFKENEEQYIFNGFVNENSFRVSLKIKRPQNFLPLIEGNITDITNGSLISLSYKMFTSSLIFLIFWTFVTFISAIIIWFQYKWVWASSGLVLLGLLHLLIARLSFHKQLDISRQNLSRIFEEMPSTL